LLAKRPGRRRGVEQTHLHSAFTKRLQDIQNGDIATAGSIAGTDRGLQHELFHIRAGDPHGRLRSPDSESHVVVVRPVGDQRQGPAAHVHAVLDSPRLWPAGATKWLTETAARLGLSRSLPSHCASWMPDHTPRATSATPRTRTIAARSGRGS